MMELQKGNPEQRNQILLDQMNSCKTILLTILIAPSAGMLKGDVAYKSQNALISNGS